jgi:prephenate dehydrogenase
MVEQKRTVAVVGLGLIGASLALALKGKYRVWGCSRSPETEELALSRGYIDEVRAIENLRGADCVVICSPLDSVKQAAERVYEAVGNTAIITDAGSVKSMLEGLSGRVVGGHPMAGNEKSGLHAARADLFENAYYCVVPYKNSLPADVEFVKEMASAAGAKPVVLSAKEHDSLAADYSHMPHMCAYAMSLAAIGERVNIAGSGFLDSTRIACSNPDFWTEVFRLNRENTLESLGKFTESFEKMKKLLEREDYGALRDMLAAARQKRIELGEKSV